jgi:two-component system, LytTR family, response regulator AlgR
VRVLIVDDEAAARRRLVLMLEELDVEVAGEAESGVDALAMIRERRPDVLLLDIAMPEVDGFDVVRHLEAPRPLVIFQTAYDEHALAAFDHEAVDYLLKPVTLDRLRRAMTRASERLETAQGLDAELVRRLERAVSHGSTAVPRRPRVLVREGNGHRLLPLAEIVRFTAGDPLVAVQARSGRFATDYTLGELEERCGRTFVRVSRGDLVNRDYVTHIASNGDGSATLTLADGARVRVSRRRAAEARAALAD